MKVRLPESWMNVGKAEWKRLHSLYRRLRKVNTPDSPRGNPVLRKYPFEVRNACGDAGSVTDRLEFCSQYRELYSKEGTEWLEARYNRKDAR